MIEPAPLAGRADGHLARHGVGERPDLRRVPGHGHVVRLMEAAEPLELSERDLQAALAGRLEDQQRLADDRQEGAVLRRHHAGMVERAQSAAARLVDHDETRIARDVPAVVTAQQPQIEVVAVAGRGVARHRDGLAGEEIRRRAAGCGTAPDGVPRSITTPAISRQGGRPCDGVWIMSSSLAICRVRIAIRPSEEPWRMYKDLREFIAEVEKLGALRRVDGRRSAYRAWRHHRGRGRAAGMPGAAVRPHQGLSGGLPHLHQRHHQSAARRAGARARSDAAAARRAEGLDGEAPDAEAATSR